MSDEIDIEEHDVMDNPSIKRIFPDLSVIKQEINQYYYEDTVMQDIKLEQPTQNVECVSYSETSITCQENAKCNEVLIDTKLNIHTEIEPLKEPEQPHGNIIILGSKPNKDCEIKISKDSQKAEPQIILKNIDFFLKECKRYCDQCFILFPKCNLYNLHKINVHSERKNGYQLHKRQKCLKCNEIFSSRSNLIRHRKNAHKSVKDNTSNQNIITNADSKIKSSKENHCFHCQKLFPTQNSLIEHLYDVLAPKTSENCNKSSKDNEENANLTILCKRDKNMPDSVEKMNIKHNMDTQVEENKLHEMKNKTKIYSKHSIKCNKCKEQFYTKNKLKYHNMTVHKHCKKNIQKNKSEQEKTSNDSKSGRLLYRCLFCSKYNVSMKFYSLHILSDHKIQVVAKAKKVPFNPQCYFCPSKMSGMKSYNAHLCKNHRKKVTKHINTFDKKENIKNNSAIKSVLFQCLECDTHFLSAREAMNHSMHLTFLNDWECKICNRKFKTKDKVLHENQHASCNTFIDYSLPKSALTLVLYKCFKCTVHYSEDTFLDHNVNCDSKTPNSMYCHFCDILVNRVDMEIHKSHHEESKMSNPDFTIIETDMLDIKSVTLCKDKINNYTTKRYQKKAKLIMNFCNTCKCFLNNTQITHKAHLEARCSHILKTICKSCGLAFTAKSHINHANLHTRKQIKLHDYLFYDLKSKKQILPPIPDYPDCSVCGVHFLRKSAIRVHSCQTQEYKTCEICSIKLTDHAYKLHMPFHNYSIQNVITEPGHEEIEPIHDVTPHLNSSDFNNATLKTDNDHATLKTENFLYTCKSCQISVKTYDDVIEHCQDHYDCKKIQLQTHKCQQCALVYISKDFCCPTKLNTTEKDKVYTCNIANFTIIDFDPCYVRFNNTFWTRHIFAYISDEQIIKILDNSMYRDECRLKMEELQPGCSNSILYKCDKCQVFIEPNCFYTHAENSKSTPCVNSAKYPCAHCGLCFSSWIYRETHVKQHEENVINPASLSCRIILFNKTEHDTFNQTMFDARNKYILYQCRNCERVVDKFQRNGHKCDYTNLKMCTNCGLLFHPLDYDLHFIRHEELDKFNADYINVVMFGQTNGLGKRLFRSTFNKARLDFTLFKCKNCELCVMSKKCMSRHICVFDESKCKCSKCGLYFLEKDLLSHFKLHESYLDGLDVNIITFNLSNIVQTSKVKLSTKEIMGVEKNLLEEAVENDFKAENDSKLKNNFKISNNCKEKNDSLVKQNISNCKIYKCVCGLHFLEYENARNHVNICNVRMKISKQSCFKCDLLFTPGELFNHLLVHHCDKKLQYKFDIVTVPKNNEMSNIS